MILTPVNWNFKKPCGAVFCLGNDKIEQFNVIAFNVSDEFLCS